MTGLIPQPRSPITTRVATLDDLAFVDALQKKHTKQVGWFPTKTIMGKIKAGHVLVAEAVDEKRETRNEKEDADSFSSLTSHFSSAVPVGYLIGNDEYFKRGDTGVIYQINIVEGKRRGLVGAALLKAQFERSAYGCKLYCCWCAQDLAANHFWEACGFVPLAFRAGSAKKGRVHIFWSKRIRAGDTTTPWWFPSETKGGAMMEDRLVFPIPPGTHWSDAKPIVLPRDTHAAIEQSGATKQIEDKAARRTTKKSTPPAEAVKKRLPLAGGLSFTSPVVEPAKAEKAKPEKKPKVKNDPRFVSAARELRDRWLEQVNAGQYVMEAAGKYDVSREIETTTRVELAGPMKLLGVDEQSRVAA